MGFGFDMVSFTSPTERFEQLKNDKEAEVFDKDYIPNQLKNGVKLLPYSSSMTSDEDTFYFEEYVDCDSNFHTIFISNKGEFICGYKYYDEGMAHTFNIDNIYSGNPMGIDYDKKAECCFKYFGVPTAGKQRLFIKILKSLKNDTHGCEDNEKDKMISIMQKHISLNDYETLLKYEEKYESVEDDDLIPEEEFNVVYKIYQQTIFKTLDESIMESFLGNEFFSKMGNVNDMDEFIFE